MFFKFNPFFINKTLNIRFFIFFYIFNYVQKIKVIFIFGLSEYLNNDEKYIVYLKFYGF